MLSTVHTLVSLPFAIYLSNPVVIFVTAVVFHLFCDTILHWNIYPDQFKRYPMLLVILDVSGGVIIAWLLTGSALFSLPMLAAIAGGNAPDIMHGLWDMLPKSSIKKRRIAHSVIRFHERLQLETTSPVAGLIPQAIFVIAALLLLKG